MTARRVRIQRTQESVQVFYENSPLYAHTAPQAVIEKRVRALSIEDHTIILIFSPLLWYGIDVLLEKCNQTHTIVCIELEPQLAAITTAHMPNPIRKRPATHFFIGGDLLPINTHIKALAEISHKQCVSINLSGGYKLHNRQYQAIKAGYQRAIRTYWQNKITTIRMGRLWMRNLFRIMAHDQRTIDIGQISTELPILVVGAGASLENNFDAIRALSDSHCVIAVDTALPILRAQQITPDMVVAVEAQIYNIKDFLCDIPQQTIVAIDLSSHPAILRIARDNTMALFSARFRAIGLFSYLQQSNILPRQIPPLGSVGVIALYLALSLTKETVATIGLDFDYQLGKTHAQDAPFLQTMRLQQSRLNPDPLVSFCLKRPSITLHNKQNRKTVSELALAQYRDYAQHLAKQHARIVDVGAVGLSYTKNSANIGSYAQTAPRINASQKKSAFRIAAAVDSNTIYTQRRDVLQRILHALDAMLADSAAQRPETQFASDIPLDFLSIDQAHAQQMRHARYSALDYHNRLQKLLRT